MAVDPSSHVPLLKAGIEHQRAGRLAEAESYYRQVLKQDPSHPSALYFLGLLAHQIGRNDQAVKFIEEATRIDSSQATFFVILGRAYQALGLLDNAETAERRAIAVNANLGEAHASLASILHARSKLEEAESTARQAISLNPRLGEAHVTLGRILKDRGQVEAAIQALREGLTCGAPPHETLNNLGNYLVLLGRLDEARAALEQSVQRAPNMPLAHWNLALVYLMQGDLKRGFAEHEWRLQHPASGTRLFPEPVWDGSRLDGKTILIHTEQGFGDAIHFIRYASLIAERGGSVWVDCQPELVSLLATVPGVHRIFSRGETIPSFNVQAAVMSLPYIFGTTLETIPAKVPYLFAPQEQLALWKSRVPRLPATKKVGVAWAGSHTHRNDHRRSIAPAELRPLGNVPNVQWFSLQVGPDSAAALKETGLDAIDLTSEIHNFADTAALIDQLDLVITVDTSVAHVAGAMARPVWILVPAIQPDWRWLMSGETTAWYPTAKLFRQECDGDWAGVIARVVEALNQA